MEALVTLLVVTTLVCVPVLAVVAFVLTLVQRGQLRRLSRSVEQLRTRLRDLSPAASTPAPAVAAAAPLAAGGGGADVPAVPPAPATETVDVALARARRAVTPPPAPTAAEAPADDGPGNDATSATRRAAARRTTDERAGLLRLETLFGQRWLVRIGVVLILAAAALLLRELAELGIFGPAARLLALAGVGLASWGVAARLRRRPGRAGLAHGVAGLGSGLLLITAHGGALWHPLWSVTMAWGMVLGVAAGTVAIAARWHAQVPAVLALFAANLSPLLLHSPGSGGEVLFFGSFVLVNATGVLLRRQLAWRWALPAVAVGSVLHLCWWALGGAWEPAFAAVFVWGSALLLPLLVAGLWPAGGDDRPWLGDRLVGLLVLAAWGGLVWLHGATAGAEGTVAIAFTCVGLLLLAAAERAMVADPEGREWARACAWILLLAVPLVVLGTSARIVVFALVGGALLHLAGRRASPVHVAAAVVALAVATLQAFAITVRRGVAPGDAAAFCDPATWSALVPLAVCAHAALHLPLSRVARSGATLGAVAIGWAYLHGELGVFLRGLLDGDAWRGLAIPVAVAIPTVAAGSVMLVAAGRRAAAGDRALARAWHGLAVVAAFVAVLTVVAGGRHLQATLVTPVLNTGFLLLALPALGVLGLAWQARRDELVGLWEFVATMLPAVLLTAECARFVLRAEAFGQPVPGLDVPWNRGHLMFLLAAVWSLHGGLALGCGLRFGRGVQRLVGLLLLGGTGVILLFGIAARLEGLLQGLAFLVVGLVFVAAAFGYHRWAPRIAEGRTG